MKILSEREYYDFHPALGLVCLVLGLVALGLVVALIFHAFKDGEFENLFAVAFLILIALILFKGFDKSLDHKMVYEYKATITDFNEVHDKGYEIVDREGEIYMLVKKEED